MSETEKERYVNLIQYVTQVIDCVALLNITTRYPWTPSKRINFSLSRSSFPYSCQASGKGLVGTLSTWLQEHEEAQVMLASVLVVFGLWWLVRALLTLFFNLICPIMMVVLAVVCVPQLRQPLLGQNYEAFTELVRNILLKLADRLKPIDYY